MPISSQVFTNDNNWTPLADLEEQPVWIHWIKFKSSSNFQVEILGENIKYNMSDQRIECMGYAQNWIQMFKLPIFWGGDVTLICYSFPFSEVTCTYAWTPCNEIPNPLPHYHVSGVDGYDYISMFPIQEEWMNGQYDIVKHTPWYWTIVSDDHPFVDNAPVQCLYIKQE